MRRAIGTVPYVYPVPIVLVGATVNGKPNFATAGYHEGKSVHDG